MKAASILSKVGLKCHIVKAYAQKLCKTVVILCAVQSTEDPAGYDSHLVAALGINWAHSVTIRLVLEAKSGWF